MSLKFPLKYLSNFVWKGKSSKEIQKKIYIYRMLKKELKKKKPIQIVRIYNLKTSQDSNFSFLIQSQFTNTIIYG